jgi:hypothetical protein
MFILFNLKGLSLQIRSFTCVSSQMFLHILTNFLRLECNKWINHHLHEASFIVYVYDPNVMA